MNIKKTLGMLGACGMILQGVVGVSAQESDSADANFDVETGERVLKFTEDSPKVSFGSIDLNGGGIKTKSAKLPEITVEDYTGTGSGYDIHLGLGKFKDSTDKELDSVDVKITSKGNESNTKYGGKVYGISDNTSIMRESSVIYKADKGNGQGKHILKEEGQSLELSVDSTELRADETYTATATISFNPIILNNPHIENPTPEKVGNEWVAKIRNAYIDEDGQNATDVYVRLREESDGSYTIANSGINKDANKHEEILYGDLKIPAMIGGKPVKKIGNSAFKNSNFTGEFNAPNLEIVDDYGFEKSNFTGDFIAPNLTDVRIDAFYSSKFTGDFNAPNVTEVGYRAFRGSNFTGDFIAPNLTDVGFDAFRESYFTGKVNMPVVDSIGSSAFESAKFTSGYINPEASIRNNNGNLEDFQK